ncbi:hypothetical protein HMPREF1619_03679 [Klebsiella pneumoniae 909957]|nr:hypothetical protein HMPREF1619_03679 [Klebsiella pneumoniae 909957]KXA29058.1 hypothetical protein HMPREF3197_00983 [Klebsiella pneumoniae]
MEMFKAGLLQPANIRGISQLSPECFFFVFTFLVKRGCTGIRTDNITGIIFHNVLLKIMLL